MCDGGGVQARSVFAWRLLSSRPALTRAERPDPPQVFRFGIKAMHNMTREFSGSAVNFQGMYRDMESAQDTFTEMVDNQDDINTLLQNGALNRGAADEVRAARAPGRSGVSS